MYTFVILASAPLGSNVCIAIANGVETQGNKTLSQTFLLSHDYQRLCVLQYMQLHRHWIGCHSLFPTTTMLLRLVYGQLSMVWLARPSPDHAHSPPADSPGLGVKVTRDTGKRPQLSNLRIYSPVKRAKPLRVGVCHKGDVGRKVLEAFSRKRAKQGLLGIRPLLTLPYQVSVR